MIDGFDWLDILEERFGNDKEINCLREKKFRGSLQIHFDNGIPLKYKLELWGDGKSNLTKGGENV